MLREDFIDSYLKYYDSDIEVPPEISNLYDEAKKLSTLFCENLCKHYLCSGNCDKDILIDTWNPYEIVGVVPKTEEIKDKNIIRIDLGFIFRSTKEEFWQYFKEEILPSIDVE